MNVKFIMINMALHLIQFFCVVWLQTKVHHYTMIFINLFSSATFISLFGVDELVSTALIELSINTLLVAFRLSFMAIWVNFV